MTAETPGRDQAGRALRTVGVEEEFLLLDRSGRRTAPVAGLVLRDLRNDPRVHGEFKQDQVEGASRPWRTMTELEGDLLDLRGVITEAAARYQARLLTSGTFAHPVTPTPVRSERFDRIAAEFTELAHGQLTCGMHVHVGVGSRQEGIDVLDRIRPWLAVLTALAANSPYWQGRDTGYASYRSIVLSQLPTAGPTPAWGSASAYDQVLENLIATGAAFDPAMVYYDARLSATFPTVELRVMDVCATVGEAVALAAICRALVDTAAQHARQGVPALDVPVGVLRGAAWRAARHGMCEGLYDPTTGRLAPAWDVAGRLVAEVGDALTSNGDAPFVRERLTRLRQLGTGAERQREAALGTPAAATE